VRIVAEKLAGKAAVVQINTRDNQALAARFAIRSIPVILLLNSGRVVEQLAGAQTPENVLAWFRRVSPGRF